MERLYLHNNQFNAFPGGMFNDLVKLEQLYLENNQLGSLPADSFSGLTVLEELKLQKQSTKITSQLRFQWSWLRAADISRI